MKNDFVILPDENITAERHYKINHRKKQSIVGITKHKKATNEVWIFHSLKEYYLRPDAFLTLKFWQI